MQGTISSRGRGNLGGDSLFFYILILSSVFPNNAEYTELPRQWGAEAQASKSEPVSTTSGQREGRDPKRKTQLLMVGSNYAHLRVPGSRKSAQQGERPLFARKAVLFLLRGVFKCGEEPLQIAGAREFALLYSLIMPPGQCRPSTRC